MKIPDKFTGKWKIYHMDQFGLVTGEIDCRVEKYNGDERIEFTWSGSDEGDDISGRGWAEVHKKEMNGWIYIHPRQQGMASVVFCKGWLPGC